MSHAAPSTTVTEAVARPVRTGAQLGAAEVILLLAESFGLTLSPGQHTAVLAALTMLVGVVHVALENRTGKAVLRTIPPTEAAVVADAGDLSTLDRLDGLDDPQRSVDAETAQPWDGK